MTIRAEIRAVLLAGPKNSAQIAQLCDSVNTELQASQNLSALKAEGKLKAVGTIDGKISYGIDKWPEKPAAGEGGGKRAQHARPKRAYRRRQVARAPESSPAPAAAKGAASFAITDTGTLALIKHDVRVDLDPDEFAALRVFIDRTSEAWNPQSHA